MIALSITSLSRSFRAGTQGCSACASVLRNLDLSLWPGELVALEGARASGRTTLLRCAAGLLEPDAGSILWFGGRVAPRNAVAYVSSAPAHPSREGSSTGDEGGALYAALSAAI